MTDGVGYSDKVHYAIEHLLQSPDGWRAVVRGLVERWPDALATELIFTLVSAASEIEKMFAPGSPSCEGAEHGWKIAALLGVDLYAMQSIGMPHTHARDFTGYWKIDPYFKEL
ncbi:MAG: hypothetical protein WBC90_00995 [Albidovulum sp.]|jgi:hypothetical protein